MKILNSQQTNRTPYEKFCKTQIAKYQGALSGLLREAGGTEGRHPEDSLDIATANNDVGWAVVFENRDMARKEPYLLKENINTGYFERFSRGVGVVEDTAEMNTKEKIEHFHFHLNTILFGGDMKGEGLLREDIIESEVLSYIRETYAHLIYWKGELVKERNTFPRRAVRQLTALYKHILNFSN